MKPGNALEGLRGKWVPLTSQVVSDGRCNHSTHFYPPHPEWSQMEDMNAPSVSCFHHVPVERISGPPDANNSKRGLQGRGFGGLEGGGGYPPPPEGSQMEDMIPLPVSCLHNMAVECMSGPPESNNSKRVLQGRGFGGFEGGGGSPPHPEWS